MLDTRYKHDPKLYVSDPLLKRVEQLEKTELKGPFIAKLFKWLFKKNNGEQSDNSSTSGTDNKKEEQVKTYITTSHAEYANNIPSISGTCTYVEYTKYSRSNNE